MGEFEKPNLVEQWLFYGLHGLTQTLYLPLFAFHHHDLRISTCSFVLLSGSCPLGITQVLVIMARKRKDPDRIKRPSNCFILFRRDLGNRKKTEKFSLSQGEVSKTAGQQWREASKEVKEYYTQLALEEKRLHEIQFPGYTFQPQRKTDVQKQDGHLALMSSTPSPSPASSSSSASQPSPSASPEETPQQTMAGPTMYTPTRHFRVDPSPFNASTVGQGMYIPSISIPVTTFDEVESDSDYTVRLHGPFGCSPTMSAATYSPLPEHVARGYSSSASPLSSPTHPDDAEAPIEFAASFTYTHTETMLHQSQPQSFETEPQYEVVENVPFTWTNPDSTWLAPQHQNNIQSVRLHDLRFINYFLTVYASRTCS